MTYEMRTSEFKILGAALPDGPFTRRMVSRLTKLPDEVLSHWTKAGLLIPTNMASGSGRHKEFDQLEVQKAELLKHMRQFGCGIETLRWFSSVIDRAREISSISKHFPLHRIWELDYIRSPYASLLEGRGATVRKFIDGDLVDTPAYSIEEIAIDFLTEGGLSPVDEGEISDASFIVKKHWGKLDEQAMRIGYMLSQNSILDSRVDGIILTWPTHEGWELYQSSEVNMSGLDTPPLAGIMLYVTRALHNLWSIRGAS